MQESYMAERRHYPRLKKQTSFTVKIKSAPDDSRLEGKSFPCYSINVSLNGLLLSLDKNIPVGSILEIFNRTGKYWHAGTVVWTGDVVDDKLEQQKTYFIGIEFYSVLSPDSDEWRLEIENNDGKSDE